MGGYERGFLEGIARYARFHGPWIFDVPGMQPELSLATDGDRPSAKFLLPRQGTVTHRSGYGLPDLRELGVSGFIGRIQNDAVARTVLNSGVPAIAMDLSAEQLAPDNPLSGLSEVHPDSCAVGSLAAEHFLEHNLRHFGFCGHPGRVWSDHREDGFRQRLAEDGLSCDVYTPSMGQSSQEHSEEQQDSLASWLRSLAKPVGVLACNDVRGLELIEACAAADLMVPDDVAIIGVDEDRLLCEVSHPSLSSVMLNSEQGGYRAAELLDDMMSGKVRDRQTILVEPLWVVARGSTDVLAIEDREVTRAVRFIQENAKYPIGVANVASAIAMSRRALEIRFQRALGRSIRVEIERARLARTKELLVETDLPAWKIAEMAGFSSLSYASKVFHREVGITMRSYRRERRSSPSKKADQS
jgi:LacI family transcriptional regulator